MYMFNFFLIFWLALLPLVNFDGHFEEPKILIFLIGNFLLFINWIIKGGTQKLFLKKSDYLYLIWILVLGISSFVSGDFAAGITGGGYRHQGILFFFSLWIIGKTVESLPSNKKDLLGRFISYVVLCEVLIVFAQIVSGKVYFGRPLGTMGDPNAVAGVLSIGIYFVGEYLPSIFSLGVFAAIILTWSKSGILSVVTYSAGLLQKKFGKALILVAISSAAIWAMFSYATSDNTSFFEDRRVIWDIAIQAISQKPLLGWGVGQTEQIYISSFYKKGIPLESLDIDSAHNLLLDIVLASGIIGAAIFAYYIYSLFYELSFAKKVGICCFLVYSMFQPLMVSHWLLATILIFI